MAVLVFVSDCSVNDHHGQLRFHAIRIQGKVKAKAKREDMHTIFYYIF